MKPVIVIHGGAGALSRTAMDSEKEQRYRAALQSIVARGQAILAANGSALDAVTE
ncbi:isoaspartyl peptidase/L-asparaginase, partial [Dickeya dianthicola]